MKYYDEALKKQVHRGKVSSASWMGAFLGLLVLFLILSILFVSRKTRSLFFGLSIGISLLLCLLFAFFLGKLLYYLKIEKHVKRILSSEEKRITSPVLSFSEKPFTHVSGVRAYEVKIEAEGKERIVYLLSDFQEKLTVGDTYDFVLADSFLKEATPHAR